MFVKGYKMQVSIIIVNYNTKKLLRDCLESIFRQTKDISFEVIVSDNGSTDGSVEMIASEFPQVILIENNANLGFGAANNRGLEIANGEFIFYLNSDTILLNNAVKIFYDYWENTPNKDEIGVLGAMLLNEEGDTIHSFGQIKSLNKELEERFHCLLGVTKDTLKYFFTRQLKNLPLDDNVQKSFFGEVPYVTGADLFMKNDSFAKFDERYFMYKEEVDMQLQLHKADKKSFMIEGPQIIHLGGASSERKKQKVVYLSSFSDIQLLISSIHFYKKNFPNCRIRLLLLKTFTLFLWLNPLIFRNTKSKIKDMLFI